VTYSSTPTFAVSAGTVQVFAMTLAGSVTSSTLTTMAASPGQLVVLKIAQPSGGGDTFVFPTNWVPTCTISPTASVITYAWGFFDGTNVEQQGCSTTDPTITGFLYSNGAGLPTAATQAQLLTLLGVLPVANGGTNNANLTFPSGTATVTQTVASGTTAATGAGSINNLGSISTASCATLTVTAANVASTDAIQFAPNGSIKALTGFVPATTGGLTIAAYPTSGYVNFDVCNWTSGSITPGDVQLNWRVVR